MDDRFQIIAQSLFNKDVSELEEDDVNHITSQYPYFAPAHFLQLSALSKGSPEYNKQYQKAILYYPDPLTFEQFIHPQPDFIFEDSETLYEEKATAETIIEEEKEDVIEDKLVEAAQPKSESALVQEKEAAPPLAELLFLKEEEKEEEPQGSGITFEPYHTVDYFASQGIKAAADQVQNKLDKQVKSFTDWLKVMKKLPAAERGTNVTPSVEQKVENLAEHSVQDADVVTESMAEVWIAQGNNEKAAEVYRKLSLQNPSKSAYFAAKIHQLTQSF